MPPEILVVCALATWRLAVIVWMGDSFERVRYKAGVYLDPQPFLGKQLGCFWCVTMYCAILCGIAGFLWWPILLPLALSGAAVLLSGGGRIVWREMVDD